MSDQAIEQEIQAKGKTAPRITPADLQANIASVSYFNAGTAMFGPVRNAYTPECAKSLDLLTFCVLVLKNGFTVTGESACASPENFDYEIGCKIARQNAEQKIWPLMGYALKQQLHQAACEDALLHGEVPEQPKSADTRAGWGGAGLDFGTALIAIKDGKRVARAGWNGKAMWIALSGSTTEPRNIAWENFWSKNASEWARTENGGGAEVLPCILMKTADNRILMGWLASQSDMLAEDWQIV